MKKPPSWFDRALLSVAPQWALRRIRARGAAEMIGRHFEAAAPGRRTSGWARNGTDVDLTNSGALIELRLHARDLLRNNAYARRARSTIANNAVSWGIVPRPAGADAVVNTKALQLWKNWAESTECESEGRHTFAGIQHLAMKSIVSDGEILIRRRYRLPKDALTLPIQLQVLEADFLDTAKRFETSQSGGPIINGVEYDPIGRRSAYWLFEKHPGSGRNASASRRISADDVIHVAYTERPAQTRGVSWLAAAIVNLKDLDDYDDAELMKQKIAACFSAFITDTDGQGALVAEKSDSDPLLETMQPGMVEQLPPGKSITFANPPNMTSDMLPTRTLRRVAAALGITYEDISGDYSQVNFSSARMARLSHWAHVYDWQWNMLIPLLCRPVWDWAMEAAVIAGELPEAPGGVDWTTPPIPMIEPDKEGLAIQRLIRNGQKTLSESIREQGYNPDQHFAEMAADAKRLDDLELVLDSDPRKTTVAGQQQPSETADLAPEPPIPTPPPPVPPKRDDDTELSSDVEAEVRSL